MLHVKKILVIEYNPENLNIPLYKPKYMAKGINEKIDMKKTITEELICRLKSRLSKKSVIIKDKIEEKKSIIKTSICFIYLGVSRTKVLKFIKY
tara:strand:+ start:3760 stop:4041 length:282 start_codon:yes stop_codon:yes gene_type:complete